MKGFIQVLMLCLFSSFGVLAQDSSVDIELYKDKGEKVLRWARSAEGDLVIVSAAEKAYLVRFIDKNLNKKWTKLIPVNELGGEELLNKGRLKVVTSLPDIYLLQMPDSMQGMSTVYVAQLDTTGRVRKIIRKQMEPLGAEAVTIVDDKLTWLARNKDNIYYMERTDPQTLRSYKSSLHYMQYKQRQEENWDYLGSNGHDIFLYLNDTRAIYDTVPQIRVIIANAADEPVQELGIASLQKYKNFSLPPQRAVKENKISVDEGDNTLIAYGLSGKPLQDSLPLHINYTGFYITAYDDEGEVMYDKEISFSSLKDAPAYLKKKEIDFLTISAIVPAGAGEFFVMVSPTEDRRQEAVFVIDKKKGNVEKVLSYEPAQDAYLQGLAPLWQVWLNMRYDRRADGPTIRKLSELNTAARNKGKGKMLYDVSYHEKGDMIIAFDRDEAKMTIYHIKGSGASAGR